METVRLIVCSNVSGEEETMTFTDDFEVSSEDYCSSGQTVDIDKKIEMDVPSGFPMNHTFVRN